MSRFENIVEDFIVVEFEAPIELVIVVAHVLVATMRYIHTASNAIMIQDFYREEVSQP
jgi:hypothetical protein